MARVPTLDNFSVMPDGLPGVTVQPVRSAVDPGQQLGQQSQAIERAGAVGMAIENDIRNEQIRTTAKEADIAFTSQLNNLLHAPDSGFLSRKGRDAVDGYEHTTKAFDELQRKSLKSIKDPLAQRMAKPVFQDRLMSALSSAQKHVAVQKRSWQIQTSESRASLSIQDAASNYRDDEAFTLSLGTALNEAAEQGALQGWDESGVTLKRRAYIDEAFRMRYEAWRQDDAASALADFQRNAGRISPLVRDQISRHLFSAAAPQLAAQINQLGGVGEIVARRGGSAEPRGIRNNNPGNIVKGGDPWQGEVDGTDKRYASFSSPEAGIRAMGRTLLTYQEKHGLDSVEGIVSRWAPATENDTRSYITTVSKVLGVAPGERINLGEPSTLAALTRAMIQFENGKQPYTEAQIAAGIGAALGRAELPATTASSAVRADWRDPAIKTGLEVIDSLSPDQRVCVLQIAQAQAAQARFQAREGLHSRVEDTVAEYLAQGFASDAPTEEEFIRAYGQEEGVRRYQDLQDTATLGVELQRTGLLPNQELDTMLQDARPAPGEGFAARMRNFETLQKAVVQTKDAREKDPIAYALRNPAYGIEPLREFRNPAALSQELGKRSAVMWRIAADYGTRPVLMTPDEADAFADHVGSLQTADKARVLGVLFGAVGAPGMQAISAQLKEKHSTLAVAGMLSVNQTTAGNSAALLYLQGRDAIEQKRAKIDEAAEIGTKAEIYKAIDGVYQTPQGRDAAAEAAFGIYAKFKADGGGDVGQAVRIATGGIMEFNGGKIAKPYGWQDGQFRDALRETVPAALAAQGADYLVGGQRVGAADLARMLPGARLQTYGQGSYLVMSGNDVVREANGNPFILRMH